MGESVKLLYTGFDFRQGKWRRGCAHEFLMGAEIVPFAARLALGPSEWDYMGT
jgi:hypothetical protein